jgi:hypothetical protein
MARDRRHYVPAALIGRFSAHPKSSARESRVAVHYFDPTKIDIERKAENIGWARNIYRGELVPGFNMDRYFSKLEQMSLTPVDELEKATTGSLPAREWARVAAYITSQFVRNPDLEDQIQHLIASGVPPERVLAGNPLDTQRVGSAVYRARWEFFRTTKDLILNDRGISVVGGADDWGYFIPLRKRFGVRIGGGPYPKQLTWNGASWSIDIPITSISDDRADLLNSWTWATGAKEVYGSSLSQIADVERNATKLRAELPDLAKNLQGAGMLTLSKEQRRADEMLITWLPQGIKPPGADGPTEMTI